MKRLDGICIVAGLVVASAGVGGVVWTTGELEFIRATFDDLDRKQERRDKDREKWLWEKGVTDEQYLRHMDILRFDETYEHSFRIEMEWKEVKRWRIRTGAVVAVVLGAGAWLTGIVGRWRRDATR